MEKTYVIDVVIVIRQQVEIQAMSAEDAKRRYPNGRLLHSLTIETEILSVKEAA